MSTPRLLEMLERLPAYDGALSARSMQEAQSEQGSVSGVRVGGGSSAPSTQIEEIGSSGAELTSHPALAGMVEYVKV